MGPQCFVAADRRNVDLRFADTFLACLLHRTPLSRVLVGSARVIAVAFFP